MSEHWPNDPSARLHLINWRVGPQPCTLAAWVDAGSIWLARVGDRDPTQLSPAQAHALAQCLTALARLTSSDTRATDQRPDHDRANERPTSDP